MLKKELLECLSQKLQKWSRKWDTVLNKEQMEFFSNTRKVAFILWRP
jgi:hypothetical protein